MVTSFDDRTYRTGDSNAKYLARKRNRGNFYIGQAFEGRTVGINEPTHLPVLDSFFRGHQLYSGKTFSFVDNLTTGNGCITDKCACLRHTVLMRKGYVLQMMKRQR